MIPYVPSETQQYDSFHVVFLSFGVQSPGLEFNLCGHEVRVSESAPLTVMKEDLCVSPFTADAETLETLHPFTITPSMQGLGLSIPLL